MFKVYLGSTENCSLCGVADVVFYVLAKSIFILVYQASGRWREAVQGPHIAGSGNQALPSHHTYHEAAGTYLTNGTGARQYREGVRQAAEAVEQQVGEHNSER